MKAREEIEVKNPVVQFFLVITAVILAIVLSPVMVPLHFILRAWGRKGCYRKEDNRIEVQIDAKAFRKRRP